MKVEVYHHENTITIIYGALCILYEEGGHCGY